MGRAAKKERQDLIKNFFWNNPSYVVKFDPHDDAKRAALLRQFTSAILVGTINTFICFWTTRAMGVQNWKAYFIPVTLLSLAYVGYETRRIYMAADRYLHDKFLLPKDKDII